VKIIKSGDITNQLILELTSAEFLNLSPVLAGGFVAWLFEISYNRPSKVGQALNAQRNLRKIDDIRNLSSVLPRRHNKINYPITYKTHYLDIDCWFLKSNDVWNPQSKWHPLVSDTTDKIKIQEAGMNLGFPSLTYKSEWAHTFARDIRADTGRDVLQIITREYENIDDILDVFDLDACKIAWHNGHFYATQEFLDTFKKKEIVISSGQWSKAHHVQKVHTVLRAFKYHKRTGYYLSEDSLDKVFRLYQDVLDHNITKAHITEKSTSIASVVINTIQTVFNPIVQTSGYNRLHSPAPTNSIIDLHTRLLDSFEHLLVQPGFLEKMLPFFIGTGYENIDKQVAAAMEYMSGNRIDKKEESKDNLLLSSLDF